ncbi:hypothetical protein L208DRAFT_222737 [Tricholoma matsutake]|nr:hypothetical protein L208DRAFT_222737 [Tricholoma matsutake 945]
MPPAPTSSDLSMDKELLNRWSARENPHGSPSHRPSSHTKRHASFDSPREVPLPSPSLSLSSPGIWPVSSSPFTSSGATPSPNTASHNKIASSSRIQEPTDYFPTPFSQPKTDSSSSSSSSFQSSSRVSFLKSRAFSSGVSEDEEYQGHDYGREPSDLSDWTSQTSPSPPVMWDTTEERKQLPDQQFTLSLASSDLKHRSFFQTTHATSALGSSTMTPSPRPLNTLEENDTTTTDGTGSCVNALPPPIFPFARPYSVPDGPLHSSKSCNTANPPDTASRQATGDSGMSDSAQPGAGTSMIASAVASSWPDRSSSASLPLPSQIPFHILSTVEHAMAVGFSNPSDDAQAPGNFSYLDESNAGSSWAETRHHSNQNQQNNPYQHNHPQSSISSSPGSSSLHSAESNENDDERVASPWAR